MNDTDNIIEVTRLTLGALRAFVPGDIIPTINYILAQLGDVQMETTGAVTREGNGKSHATARHDLQEALSKMMNHIIQSNINLF